MSLINILDKNLTKVGEINSELISTDNVNVTVVHQVVKTYLNNIRQGTAATKTKAMVSGGGKKPFKQKGTGNARQGSNRSPLMPGGGTAHGPQPKDYNNKINKKTIKVALSSVLADKLNNGKLIVVKDLPSYKKTKEVASFLTSKKMESALIVVADSNSSNVLAARNLQKSTCQTIEQLNVYSALKYEFLIIEEVAMQALLKKLGN